jgi:hypothetical protein
MLYHDRVARLELRKQVKVPLNVLPEGRVCRWWILRKPASFRRQQKHIAGRKHEFKKPVQSGYVRHLPNPAMKTQIMSQKASKISPGDCLLRLFEEAFERSKVRRG